MNIENTKYLCAIYGRVHALHDIQSLRPLNRAEAAKLAQFQAAYAERGLSFAESRKDNEALRELTAAGFLKASGATQGRAHKLTPLGMAAKFKALGMDWGDCADMLKRIIKAQDQSDVRSVYGHNKHDRIAMSWHLIPSAGPWLSKAGKSQAAWQEYVYALAGITGPAMPSLVMGWVHMSASPNARWIGFEVTEKGRIAADDFPAAYEGEIEAAEDDCFNAWGDSFDATMKGFADSTPPSGYEHFVPCVLPASQWC